MGVSQKRTGFQDSFHSVINAHQNRKNPRNTNVSQSRLDAGSVSRLTKVLLETQWRHETSRMSFSEAAVTFRPNNGEPPLEEREPINKPEKVLIK